MSTLALAQPHDQDAIRALMSRGAPLHFSAGGTDMLIAGRPRPQDGFLVDLTKTAELSGISEVRDHIRIGATTTVAELADDRLLQAKLPALTQAAAQCGAVQIRNRAPIGGNIAQAAPAADLSSAGPSRSSWPSQRRRP